MAPIIPVGQTPPAEWQNVTANLSGMSSECGNVGGIYPNPKRDQLIAGIHAQDAKNGAAAAALAVPIDHTIKIEPLP